MNMFYGVLKPKRLFLNNILNGLKSILVLYFLISFDILIHNAGIFLVLKYYQSVTTVYLSINQSNASSNGKKVFNLYLFTVIV